MKFWEAMKALQEHKKIRYRSRFSGRFIPCEHYLFNLFIRNEDIFDDRWEIYEEPKPKINLTAEHVGRKVLLRNGAIALVILRPRESAFIAGKKWIWKNGVRIRENVEIHIEIHEDEFDVIEILE